MSEGDCRPHAVLFVGDLMDGTVRLTCIQDVSSIVSHLSTSDEEYEKELARFRHVFSMPSHLQRLFVAGRTAHCECSADLRDRKPRRRDPISSIMSRVQEAIREALCDEEVREGDVGLYGTR